MKTTTPLFMAIVFGLLLSACAGSVDTDQEKITPIVTEVPTTPAEEDMLPEYSEVDWESEPEPQGKPAPDLDWVCGSVANTVAGHRETAYGQNSSRSDKDNMKNICRTRAEAKITEHNGLWPDYEYRDGGTPINPIWLLAQQITVAVAEEYNFHGINPSEMDGAEAKLLTDMIFNMLVQ